MNDTLKWDQRFLGIAQDIAGWSKDPSLGVGAVIVNELGQIVGTGYNGFPRGVNDDEGRYLDRGTKLKFTVHAELNAILLAGKEARGSVIYTTFPPCCECSKAIIQSGIEVVVSPPIKDGIRAELWRESWKTSEVMFSEAGIKVYEVEFT